MANMLGHLPIAQVAVATATVTKILSANGNRRSLIIWNETGSDIYLAYTNTAPSDTTTMHKLPDGNAISWNVLEIPITDVYCYQASGSPVNVKVQEGY